MVDNTGYALREVIIAATKFTEKRKHNKKTNNYLNNNRKIPSPLIEKTIFSKNLISSQDSSSCRTLNQLQQHCVNNFVHLTQRVLPAASGTRVRGVEMLPSIDVPNIPSTETLKKKNFKF